MTRSATAQPARALVLAVLIASLMLAALPGLAQDAPEPIPLVDAVFDELALLVPDGWHIWQRADFDTFEEADAAARELVESVLPADSPALTAPFMSPFARLYVLNPERTPDDFLNSMRVDLMPLEELAELSGMSADQITTPLVSQVGGFPPLATYTLGGNEVVFGIARNEQGQQLPRFSAVHRIARPEGDVFVQVIYFSAPQDLVTDPNKALFLINSLRPADQPLDADAILAATGMPEVPATLALPVGAEATPEATGAAPAESTPEPGADADEPAATEAAEEPASAVSCSITAPSTVNLRSGAGTSFGVVDRLAPGTELAATGQMVGGDGMTWWQLETGAWARSDVVTETGDCEALPVVAP